MYSIEQCNTIIITYVNSCRPDETRNKMDRIKQSYRGHQVMIQFVKVVFSMAMLTYGKSPPRTTTLPGLIGHLMTRAIPRWKAQNPVYDFDWPS